MGTPMSRPAVLVHHQAAPVSPLLAFLAGGHAEAIARIWPAPHEGFLVLPGARRHAAAVLAVRGRASADDIAWLVSRTRDNDLADELFGSAPPGGLMRVFARLGEQLWPIEAYDRLLALYGDEAACRLMRHMPEIRREVLASVSALPPCLRQAGVVKHLGTDEEAARDLGVAFDLALRVRGAGSAAEIAQRLGRSKNRQALFDMARKVIEPRAFGKVRPAPALPPPFRPVDRIETLSNVALEFRNCLRDFVADLAANRMAVYVWRGDSGAAAVALRQDPAGWRLAEVRGHGNADVPDEMLVAIVAAIRSAGIRTGLSWGGLYRRLEDRATDGPDVVEVDAVSWRDQLALGNIWD